MYEGRCSTELEILQEWSLRFVHRDTTSQTTSLNWFWDWKTSHWYEFYPLFLSVSSGLWHKCKKVSHPAALHQFMLGVLGNLIVFHNCLIVIINGQMALSAGSHETQGSQPNPQRNWKWKKMYVIKNKICAEYRGMIPMASAALSGTPGLRPIGLSPDKSALALGLGYHVLLFCTDLNLYSKLHAILHKESFGSRLTGCGYYMHHWPSSGDLIVSHGYIL